MSCDVVGVIGPRGAVVLHRVHRAGLRHVDNAVRAQRVEQERHGILARGMRQLVHERAHRKGLRDVAHRAVPADARVRRGPARLHANVRELVRHVGDAQRQLAVGVELLPGRKRRVDGRRRNAMSPRAHLPFRVQRRLEALHRHRVRKARLDVVLARPHHLHGRARLLAQPRRFGNEIGLRLAPESAAEERRVHRHVLLGDLEHCADGVARALRVLRAGPRLAAVALHDGQRRRRLHGRLRQMRRVILGVESLFRASQGGCGIADVAHLVPRAANGRLEFLAVCRRVVAVVRTRAPGDHELLASFNSGPGAAGDHRHAAQGHEARGHRRARDFEDLVDALHLVRGSRVDGRDPRAVHRRMQHDGDPHAGHGHVLPEHRLASDHRVEVEPRDLLADVAKLRLLLQLHVGRHGERAGAGDELAVAQRAARVGVRHAAALAGHFARRHAPLRGGGALEHHARGGARLPELHVRAVADARGTVGVLAAVLRVANGLLHAHGGPVGLELIGHGHHQRGARALPHLGAVHDHRDNAILANAQVDGRLERLTFLPIEVRIERLEPAHAGGAYREHQAAGRKALQERAAFDLLWCRHGQRAPVAAGSPAAARMASRMRVYVPQRQSTTDIAWSMSASVGLGFFFSSAAAAMICPDWQ